MAAPSFKAVHLALRNRLLTHATLPASRAWENERFAPVAGVPYIEEDFVPATAELRGITRGGDVVTEGLYVIRWFGLEGTSLDLHDALDAALALFAPESTLTATDGTVVRIRGDQAPTRSQIARENGRAVATITIPFRLHHNN